MAYTLEDILERIRSLRLLVVGDVMLDHYLWGDATRISPEAPVPVVHVERDSYAAGGAANVALNIAALGARVELCGVVGDDEAATRLRGLLGEAGVVFEPCWSREDLKTIVKARVIVRNQQLCRLDREDVPPAYALSGTDREASLSDKIREADALILSDYAKGALDEALLENSINQAHAHGTLVALDPKPSRKLAFRGVDLMTPNLSESLALAGVRAGSHEPFPAEAVCAAIWEKHAPRDLVITLGADGMLLSNEGKPGARMPTRAREVFDVSGAGDTVIAALTCARACGASLQEAADFANHAAGVVVAKLGTAVAAPKEILQHARTEA